MNEENTSYSFKFETVKELFVLCKNIANFNKFYYKSPRINNHSTILR